MGMYLNPKNGQAKEQWLAEHGERMPGPRWPPEKGFELVCLVENYSFKAAGVCYTEGEMKAFAYEDGRPREWWKVKTEELLKPGAGLKQIDLDILQGKTDEVKNSRARN